MAKLKDIAKVLRSKNSGPFQITLDILFDDAEKYRMVRDSGVICRETICRLYHLNETDITGIVFFDQAMGIKITYDRTGSSSGTCGERDVYGAQQHAPLLDIEIE